MLGGGFRGRRSSRWLGLKLGWCAAGLDLLVCEKERKKGREEESYLKFSTWWDGEIRTLNSLCRVYEVVISEQKELMSISQHVASVAGVQVLRRNASVRLGGSGPIVMLLQYLGSLEEKECDCSIVK